MFMYRYIKQHILKKQQYLKYKYTENDRLHELNKYVKCKSDI